MKFIGIIPARYASTRFPGKPLAMLGDKTVIQRVYEQASKELEEVVVATDDLRIYDAVNGFGGKAVMTSPNHKSGTDRLREAYLNLGSNADVVVNIQGDEPFIKAEQIATLKECFNDSRTEIATLVRPFGKDATYEEISNPNTPKVVTDGDGYALYFSRSVIPYIRNYQCQDWPRLYPYLAHIGIYAYRANILMQITSLEPSPLELAESLEQLRWLQAGLKIKTALTQWQTIGIDTPEDLERAKKLLV